MTYKEILAAIQGNQNRLKDDWQRQAIIAYRQSDLQATLVGRVFGSKSQAPDLYEAFPGIFPEQLKPRQQNWELMKARIETYAAERRKRGEKTSGNDA